MENKHTVYFNMCHHYRKILSAKPRVDTSLPKTLQTKANINQWKLQRKISSQNNLKQQASIRNINIRQNNTPVICQYYYQHHFKDKCENADKSLLSTAIKNNNAQSKLQTSRTGKHCSSSRKKRVQVTVGTVSDKGDNSFQEKHNNQQKITANETQAKLRLSKRVSALSVNSYSEESSEDSAYNEGECNLSSDSRGSTPQNANNKRDESAEQLSVMNSKSILLNLPQATRNRKNDIVCIQFLKDITNDILRKNVFTNKALRSIFQQHIKLNKYDLQMENMLTELVKLQEQLGVPKDEKFDDENYGLGGINLNAEIKQLAVESEDEGITSAFVSPLTVPQIENDLANRNTTTNSSTYEANKDDVRDDYSDDFSEGNTYSEDSRTQHERSDRSRESSVEIHDEVASEIDEVQEIEKMSEKYSDIDESISRSQSDLEISEVC